MDLSLRPRITRRCAARLLCALVIALHACGGNHVSVTAPVARVQDPQNITELAGYSAADLRDTVFEGTLHLRAAGPVTAPPVLLVHGIGENGARDFFPILPALAKHYRVYAVDLPGFGRSTHGDALYSPHNYVRVLSEVVRPYISSKFALIGHSMGGAIALEYAHQHPEDVTALALIDAAGILHRSALLPLIAQTGIGNLFEPGAGVVGALTGIMVDRAAGPESILHNDFARSHVLTSPNQIAAAALIVHNFGAAIAELRTPTLVVWGGHDGIAPLRTGKLLASRLPGAKLVLLERSGHVPMQTEPDELSRTLENWLEAPAGLARESRASVPLESAPLGRCENTDGAQFSGEYAHIEIVGCHGVRINAVRARSISIRSSQVVIEATQINSPELALDVTDSQVEMTGSVAVGRVALRVNSSELDVAGTEFSGKDTAIRCSAASRILFSASSIVSPLQHSFVHDIVELQAQQGM